MLLEDELLPVEPLPVLFEVLFPLLLPVLLPVLLLELLLVLLLVLPVELLEVVPDVLLFLLFDLLAASFAALAPLSTVKTMLGVTRARNGDLLLAEMLPQVPGQVDMDGDEAPAPAGMIFGGSSGFNKF